MNEIEKIGFIDETYKKLVIMVILKTMHDVHLKAVSVPRILIWSFLLCELLKWAALWNSQSEKSRTMKQPIREEPHCETANQSRAALWNSQ